MIKIEDRKFVINVATTSMFASVTLSPPENLNIPPIQIPSPTEYDGAAHSAATAATAARARANPRLIPLLGTPPPQQRRTSFAFPATAAATASVTAAESAASILLSIAQSGSASSAASNATPAVSPLAPPSKCRRVTSFMDYCRVCEISLLNVPPGIYADVCKSCEDIQHAFRKGTSFPACIVCSNDAYHIHRNCNQAICKRCLHQHTLCPFCKVRIDKQ